MRDRQTDREREIEGQPDTGRGRGREKCEKLMKRMKERQRKTEKY